MKPEYDVLYNRAENSWSVIGKNYGENYWFVVITGLEQDPAERLAESYRIK